MSKPGALFRNARCLLSSGIACPGWLAVEDGRIAGMGAGEPPACSGSKVVDARGLILAPGLVDLHVHGALSHETMDATPEALREMAQFYARHGVTGFLATTMSAPKESILAALSNVREVMARGTGGAALLGAHVEGPYIQVAKRGCQDPSTIRLTDPSEYAAWFDSGVVRLITLAPELPENEKLIQESLAAGFHVAAGHTLASYDQMVEAAETGVTQATHLYNAMPPLHHREPGAVGAALTHPAIFVQLIADGVHVHPAMLDLAARCKGVERTILITDAMAGAGMPDGDYELGGISVAVRDGVARTPEGALAGSTLTLERGVANMMAATELPLWEVWRMASETPAEAMGWESKGRLTVGADADLVLMDDDFGIALTMVAGEIKFTAT